MLRRLNIRPSILRISGINTYIMKDFFMAEVHSEGSHYLPKSDSLKKMYDIMIRQRIEPGFHRVVVHTSEQPKNFKTNKPFSMALKLRHRTHFIWLNTFIVPPFPAKKHSTRISWCPLLPCNCFFLCLSCSVIFFLFYYLTFFPHFNCDDRFQKVLCCQI